MLYAEDALLVHAKVCFAGVTQSSHARLHARHEVRPRDPRRATFEAHECLRGLGKVDLAAIVLGK